MASRSFEKDLSNSRRAFEELVWPPLSGEWFDGAELEPVEEENDSLKRAMDTVAGIDYYSVGNTLQSIASRVQNVRGKATYDTFTVRTKRGERTNTEFQKRKHAAENKGENPMWAVQAYVDCDVVEEHGERIWQVEDGRLRNVAIVDELELIRWLENGVDGTHYITNGTGSNGDVNADETFRAVYWSDLDKFDRDIRWLVNSGISYGLEPRTDPKTSEPPTDQNTLTLYD